MLTSSLHQSQALAVLLQVTSTVQVAASDASLNVLPHHQSGCQASMYGIEAHRFERQIYLRQGVAGI